MLACIACSAKEGGEDGSRAAATPAVRSLTSQLKDMVLKFSGSGKQYRAPAAAGSPSFRGRGYGRHYPGFIDDTSFTPTHRPGAGDVCAGAYASRTGAAATNNGSVGAASSATWDITGRGWPGIDEEEDGGVRVDVDAAVPREWMAQVEPGVQITFVTLPGGGNDLKRIRFSREMFNKWEAQRWWGENYDRIVELYNVQTFSGRQQAGGSTPNSSVDDSLLRDSSYSRGGSTRAESPVAMMPPPPSSSSKDPMSRSMSCKAMMPPPPPPPPSYAAGPSNRAAPCYPYAAAVPDPSDHVWAHHFNMLNTAASGGGGGPSSYDPSRATTSSRDEASVSISNASDMEAAEWIEQDEPGVCLTIRELGDGTRELRRVRFSRERFGEDRAKVWWEQNRDRIQAQYL